MSDTLAPELHLLASSISDQVEKARSSRDRYSIQQFINADRRKENAGLYLLYPVQEYVRCFRALGVQNREELGDLCRRRYGEPAVREAAEDLLQSEEEFGDFVSKVDQEIKASEDRSSASKILGVGSYAPSELKVLDADSDCVVALGALLQKAEFTLFVFKRHYV